MLATVMERLVPTYDSTGAVPWDSISDLENVLLLAINSHFGKLIPIPLTSDDHDTDEQCPALLQPLKVEPEQCAT